MKSHFRTLIARVLEWQVRRLIRNHRLKVVAVTGSVGKTTTKLAIASVLHQRYKVLAHPGNYNSEIGLPLSIFELEVPDTLTNPLSWLAILYRIDSQIMPKYPYDALVLEMGADQPGDIRKFMRYITPDIGVVTAIAPAHVEQFGSIDAIADEKMSLAVGSHSVLLNAEDDRVMEEASKLGVPIQTYGVEKGGVHFENIKRGENLTFNADLHLNNDVVKIKTNFIGRHSLSALAAAGAVGEELGASPSMIQDGLESLHPSAGRMQVLEGANGSTVIDDTYNSSPRSTVAALEALMELPGRRIAIMGSMNELGAQAEDGHREVGRVASKVDLLLTIGDQANRYLVAGAAEAGLATKLIHQFSSPYDAGGWLKEQLKKGDVVLAKGSQNGVFAEEAVAEILAREEDRDKLVRQSDKWKRKKHEQFGV